jgi:hypothetical protein
VIEGTGAFNIAYGRWPQQISINQCSSSAISKNYLDFMANEIKVRTSGIGDIKTGFG